MVSDVMTGSVETIEVRDTVQAAATRMEEHSIGALPVCDSGRLVGILTDRDIAVRAVGKGLGPSTKVSEVMTGEVYSCKPDDEVEVVSAMMEARAVRRLPVLEGDKIVGLISFDDLAAQGG